ncbi:MAG: hypothetical protein J7K51_08510 [Thermotogae bacterium]|nr:hypothetical protein [Thermotogota bacterium]
MRNFSGLATQIASQFALTGRTTADRKEIKDFPKLPLATSFIRKTLAEMVRLIKGDILWPIKK